jgi:hypothetical protein
MASMRQLRILEVKTSVGSRVSKGTASVLKSVWGKVSEVVSSSRRRWRIFSGISCEKKEKILKGSRQRWRKDRGYLRLRQGGRVLLVEAGGYVAEGREGALDGLGALVSQVGASVDLVKKCK